MLFNWLDQPQTKFVAVPPDWTIGQVTGEVRAHAPAIGKLYAV